MGDTGGAQASATNPGGNGVATAMTIAGGLTAAGAQWRTGQANRSIANANASMARDKQRETIAAGEFAANRVEMKARLQESAERAAQGASGGVAGAGTSGLVTAQTASNSAMDELMIKRNAARAALGYATEATADDNAALDAGAKEKMGMVSTLLNTGSQSWLESDPDYRGLRGSGLSVSRG